MEKVIYLVRHGQTEMNVQHLAQGWKDSPLTLQGKMQARALHNWFKGQNIHFKTAYSSDLGRAMATMQLIAEPGTLLYQVPGLREISFGKLDGRPREEFDAYSYEDRISKMEAEPVEDAMIRALRSLYWIAQNDTGDSSDPVLAVSHSAILYGLYSFLEHEDHLPEEIAVPNGTIMKLGYDGQNLKVLDVIYV